MYLYYEGTASITNLAHIFCADTFCAATKYFVRCICFGAGSRLMFVAEAAVRRLQFVARTLNMVVADAQGSFRAHHEICLLAVRPGLLSAVHPKVDEAPHRKLCHVADGIISLRPTRWWENKAGGVD